MQLGFLGTGRLSVPMIENLVADGHVVTAWNRTAARAAPLAAAGVRVVESPAAVCAAGGMVLSCLADDTALDAVFADGAVLAALGPGGVHVSMSTISAACAGRLAAAHAAAGVDYLGAPVIGRPDAVAGRLQSYLLAGAPAAKARVEPVLAALGRRVFDFGTDPAAANVAKPVSMDRRMPSRPKRMPAGTSPSSVPRASAASTRPTTPYETSKERA